jgi:hypothetical protein
LGTFLYRDLFLFSLLNHYLIYHVIGLICFHLVFGIRDQRRRQFESAQVEFQAFAFFGGYYIVLGVIDAVLFFNEYNSAVLFFHPTMWMVLIAAASFCISLASNETDIRKILAYALALVPPVIGSLIFPFFYRQEYLQGAAAAALFAAAAMVLFYIYLRKNYTPGRKEKVTLKPRA